ncbi:MAG: hypothetical protein ACPGU3_07810 [Litorivicinus sp.]
MKKTLLAMALTPLLATAEVTYDQILLDPDNIALNQQYVQERINAGDLSQALASIERIILLQPLNMDARTLRAQLLISLGNNSAAEQELQTLAALPLPEALQNRVAQLLEQAQTAQQRWSQSGYLSIGLGHDSNVGGHTDSGNIADSNGNNNGSYIDSEGFDAKRSDSQLFVRAGSTYSYDLGTQTQDSLYLGVRGSLTYGDDSELKDAKSLGFSVGTRINRPTVNTQVYLNYDKTFRDDLTDSRDQSQVKQDDSAVATLGVQFSRKLGDTTYNAGISYSAADFSGRATAVSDRSDANTTAVSLGVFSMLSPTLAISANLGRESRQADKPDVLLASASQDRDVTSMGAGLVVLPKAGHRVSLNARVRNLDYEKKLSADQFIRDDQETTLSAGYTLMGGVVSPELSDWSFMASASQVKTDSNMITYDITNQRYELSAIYQF